LIAKPCVHRSDARRPPRPFGMPDLTLRVYCVHRSDARRPPRPVSVFVDYDGGYGVHRSDARRPPRRRGKEPQKERHNVSIDQMRVGLRGQLSKPVSAWACRVSIDQMRVGLRGNLASATVGFASWCPSIRCASASAAMRTPLVLARRSLCPSIRCASASAAPPLPTRAKAGTYDAACERDRFSHSTSPQSATVKRIKPSNSSVKTALRARPAPPCTTVALAEHTAQPRSQVDKDPDHQRMSTKRR
jgi:hypothetical protein